ncbi:MAG: response regulator [Cyclobacteriaceae bacterium]
MQPKILLVDDREDNLLSIETILEPSGYRFVKAHSGREALKILLAEFDFAMILMDVKMPNLNGFETASLIYEREKLKHIPIIFITANNYGDDNMYKGYQSGAIDYIFKPINPDILRAKVGVLIDLYKKNRLLVEQEQKLVAINKSLEIEIKDRMLSEEKVNSLNRKLLTNIADLENANKNLERFAFMASHDLQEPLRKIRMFSDRLYLRHKESQEDVDLINRIQRAAERTQTLIADILAFSKLTAEPGDFTSVNLNDTLRDLLSDLADEIREKDAKITIDNLPTLYASARLMRPLFQNLISNALKYKKQDVNPVISIRSDTMTENQTTKLPGNRYVRIYVEDNGIGFEQKYAEDIFGMFRRLHNNGEFEGTGIGLALCKKIVEQHQGFISARSLVNQGSTFIISFPVK